MMQIILEGEAKKRCTSLCKKSCPEGSHTPLVLKMQHLFFDKNALPAVRNAYCTGALLALLRCMHALFQRLAVLGVTLKSSRVFQAILTRSWLLYS